MLPSSSTTTTRASDDRADDGAACTTRPALSPPGTVSSLARHGPTLCKVPRDGRRPATGGAFVRQIGTSIGSPLSIRAGKLDYRATWNACGDNGKPEGSRMRHDDVRYA